MVSVACVGVAGHGWNNLATASQHAHVAAICDVDDVALERAGERFPNAARFSSIDELFSSEPRRFDAVIVSVAELDWIEQRLGSKPVVTALGCQGVYSKQFQTLADLIRLRFSGRRAEITAWTDRPGAWCDPDDERRDTAARTVDEIRWSQWLGKEQSPAEFDPQLHPGAWRHSLDHGTGALGDMGPHLLALPFVGLELADAAIEGVEVIASSGLSAGRFPEEAHIRFLLRAAGDSEVVLNSYHGVPPPIEIESVRVPENGCLVAAEELGVVALDWLPAHAFAVSDGKAVRIDLPSQQGQSSIGAWLEAMSTADRTPTDFLTFGIPLTRLVLAGCDALRSNTS